MPLWEITAKWPVNIILEHSFVPATSSLFAITRKHFFSNLWLVCPLWVLPMTGRVFIWLLKLGNKNNCCIHQKPRWINLCIICIISASQELRELLLICLKRVAGGSHCSILSILCVVLAAAIEHRSCCCLYYQSCCCCYYYETRQAKNHYSLLRTAAPSVGYCSYSCWIH